MGMQLSWLERRTVNPCLSWVRIPPSPPFVSDSCSGLGVTTRFKHTVSRKYKRVWSATTMVAISGCRRIGIAARFRPWCRKALEVRVLLPGPYGAQPQNILFPIKVRPAQPHRIWAHSSNWESTSLASLGLRVQIPLGPP